MELNEQTFETLLPDAYECILEINGQVVSGAKALAPNGMGLNTTAGEWFEGPVVYCGDGSYEAIHGLNLQDAIAVIELGSQNTNRILQEGAQAIIYVETKTITCGLFVNLLRITHFRFQECLLIDLRQRILGYWTIKKNHQEAQDIFRNEINNSF